MRPAIVLLTLLALTLPATASDETNVGSLVQRLAQAKNVDATDARIAVDSLRDVGVELPADLDLAARLTEGEVARISRSIGLNVSTNRPEALFSKNQLDRFFESFQVELALRSDTPAGGGLRPNAEGRSFDPFTKGKGGMKGKKKGHGSAPTEPE